MKKQAQGCRGTGGEETTAETTAVDSTPRTSQDILGYFAEDWLETLDKNEIKSISFFLCYHFVHAFSFIETKAEEYAASMMKKSDRTARGCRSTLIDDGVLPELEQCATNEAVFFGKTRNRTRRLWSMYEITFL